MLKLWLQIVHKHGLQKYLRASGARFVIALTVCSSVDCEVAALVHERSSLAVCARGRGAPEDAAKVDPLEVGGVHVRILHHKSSVDIRHTALKTHSVNGAGAAVVGVGAERA